jgi:hypothetical protein
MMNALDKDAAAVKIAALNDAFRTTFHGVLINGRKCQPRPTIAVGRFS